MLFDAVCRLFIQPYVSGVSWTSESRKFLWEDEGGEGGDGKYGKDGGRT